jgi:superfamily II DNA helicase RecQ
MAIFGDEILEGEIFEDALRQVCYFFQVDKLYDDQISAIKSFFKGNDVFLCASTGYGKSIVFQCIPLLTDILLEQVIGTSTAIVICPLVSLMHDQVKKMNNLGISAAAVYKDQNEDVLDDILDACYSLIFTSPESMLATKRWEKIWKSQSFMEDCVCIAIDEAHCISQW